MLDAYSLFEVLALRCYLYTVHSLSGNVKYEVLSQVTCFSSALIFITLMHVLMTSRIGLSRERVRQVGLVALEKLKHAARRKRLEAMLVKQ